MALQDSYNFLNSYLSKITGQAQDPDDQPLQDENDFYNIQDQDQPEEDDGGYSLTGEDDDEDTEMNSDSEDPESMFNDNDNADESYDYSGIPSNIGTVDDEGGTGTGAAPTPAPGSLGHSISDQESGGKYSATNKHSSAVGKYQFLWSAWGDSIKKVTGVNSKEQFKNSPKAQEKYYAWYEKHYLMPQVEKIRQYNKAGLSDQQLAKLVHFRGAGGAKKYLQGSLPDKPESYNVPISKYLGTKQLGGHAIAMSPGAKYTGLNNSSFDSMSFPMTGENEFRGLDDGTPVYMEDETGKKKVLKGKHQKTKMKGKVFEKRLN